MNKLEILKKVECIFRDVFDDESLIITEKTSSSDIEDWDSLEQINLIVAMEKEFNVKFNIEEVSKLNNVGDMINLIGVHLNEN